MSVRSNIETFLEYLGEAVVLVDENAKIEFANRACLKLLGYQSEELFGQSINTLLVPEQRKNHATFAKNYIRARSGPIRMTTRRLLQCLTQSGHKFPVRVSLSTIEIDDNSYGIAIIQDYSLLQKWVDDIEHKAITDPLTLLYNRNYLDATILPDNRWLIARKTIGVLYLDLDRFKPINDLYGHAFGDFVLKRVAQRMKENIRSDDLAFRIGGDEFVIMLALDDTLQPLDTAKTIAKKLHQEISSPISFEDGEVSVGVSIGIALFPNDFDDIEIIIKLADKAMYHAKNQGKRITCISDLPGTIKT